MFVALESSNSKKGKKCVFRFVLIFCSSSCFAKTLRFNSPTKFSIKRSTTKENVSFQTFHVVVVSETVESYNSKTIPVNLIQCDKQIVLFLYIPDWVFSSNYLGKIFTHVQENIENIFGWRLKQMIQSESPSISCLTLTFSSPMIPKSAHFRIVSTFQPICKKLTGLKSPIESSTEYYPVVV